MICFEGITRIEWFAPAPERTLRRTPNLPDAQRREDPLEAQDRQAGRLKVFRGRNGTVQMYGPSGPSILCTGR